MAKDRAIVKFEELTRADGTVIRVPVDDPVLGKLDVIKEKQEEADFEQKRDMLETKVFKTLDAAVTVQERAMLQGYTVYNRWDGSKIDRGILKSTRVKIVERVHKSFVENHGLKALLSLISNKPDSKLDKAMLYGSIVALEELVNFIYKVANESGADIEETLLMVTSPLADLKEAHAAKLKVIEASSEEVKANASEKENAS